MRTIIVGVDEAGDAEGAVLWAGLIARDSGAALHVVHVLPSVEDWITAALQVDPDVVRKERQQLLDEVWTRPLRDNDVPHRTSLLVGKPAETLMKVAADEGADLLVIGAPHRRGVEAIVVGTVARDLLHHARRPVVVVPKSYVPSV